MTQKIIKNQYGMPERQRLLNSWVMELGNYLMSEHREACGTLCPGISTEFDSYELKDSKKKQDKWPTEQFVYWDLEKQGFRTFKASRLIKIKAATIVGRR